MNLAPTLLLPVAFALATAASCTASRPVAETVPQRPRSVESFGRPSVDPLLDATTTAAGEPIRYPASPLPLVTSQIVTIAPGQATGWHRHAVPTFGYLLSGRLEVEYADGTRRTLVAGDSLMEAMQLAHDGVNLGTEPVRILVVFMGSQGKAPTMKADPPSLPAGLGGARESDLVDLSAVDPRLRLDLRYAGPDNFTGETLYPVARALMQRPAAEALRRANERALARGYALLVFDAYRPWRVTRLFWDRYPMHRAYLADPLEGSRHNRGCAVDLTLFDLARGVEVEMPSAWDDFSEKSHPGYTGGTPAQREARDLLRSLLEVEGFTVHEREWWHFDYRGWQDWPVLDEPLETAGPRATAAP